MDRYRLRLIRYIRYDPSKLICLDNDGKAPEAVYGVSRDVAPEDLRALSERSDTYVSISKVARANHLSLYKDASGGIFVKFEIIDDREKALKGVTLRADGRLHSEFYEPTEFAPKEIIQYYDIFEAPSYSVKMKNEFGISLGDGIPYKIFVRAYDARRQGEVWNFEFDADRAGFISEWMEKNPEEIFAPSIPNRHFYNGKLMVIHHNKFRAEMRDPQAIGWTYDKYGWLYDQTTGRTMANLSPGFYDRFIVNSLLAQILSPKHNVPIISDEQYAILREMREGFGDRVRKTGVTVMSAIPVIIGLVIIFKVFRMARSHMETKKKASLPVAKGGKGKGGGPDRGAGILDDILKAKDELSAKQKISELFPEDVGNLAAAMNDLIDMGDNLYGPGKGLSVLAASIKEVQSDLAKLPQALKANSAADRLYRAMVKNVYKPQLIKYAEKRGLNAANLDKSGNFWTINGQKVLVNDPCLTSLRGEKNPNFLEYLYDKMVDQLISSLADRNPAVKRIWGYHDSDQLASCPWLTDKKDFDRNPWFKTERARSMATPEQARLGNRLDALRQKLARTADPEMRKDIQDEIDRIKEEAGDVKAYMGWYEVPLEQAFLTELYQFMSGNLQDQIVWTRHLLKLTESLDKAGKPDMLIPEASDRAACVLYLLGDQYFKVNHKLRKGVENWIWRSYFEEVYLSRMMATKDYEDPFQGYQLTGSIFKKILNNVASLPQNIATEVNALDDNKVVPYKTMRKVFEWSRTKNEPMHGYIMQEIVDRLMLPPAFESMKEAQMPIFTRPTVYISPIRTLKAITFLDGYFISAMSILAIAGSHFLYGYFSSITTVTPVVATLLLLTLKLAQVGFDRLSEGGWDRFIDSLAVAPTGLMDSQIGIFKKMRSQGRPEHAFMAEDEWNKLSEEEQNKAIRSISHFERWGRIIPGFREFVAIAAGIGIAFGANSIGLPVWLSSLTAAGSLLIWQKSILKVREISGKPRHLEHLTFSIPGLLNLSLPIFSWIFALPMLSGMFGLTGLKFALFIGLPVHLLLGLFFIFMLRGSMYSGQVPVILKAIKERHMFDVRYGRLDVNAALDAVKLKLTGTGSEPRGISEA